MTLWKKVVLGIVGILTLFILGGAWFLYQTNERLFHYVYFSARGIVSKGLEDIGLKKRGSFELVKLESVDSLAGTTVTVDPHHEYVSFGSNIRELIMAPIFWDIDSSLEEGTFEVTITVSYDELVTDHFGIDEDTIGIFIYDLETRLWTRYPSEVNKRDNTIRFTIDRFPRFSIGTEDTREKTPRERGQ